MKFIVVPSFMCVHFWLVHVHYINMHLPLFFDVLVTQVHCLPTNYYDNYCHHNIIGILLSMSLDSIFVPSVVKVSVPSLSYMNMPISIVLVLVHCVPTNYGNHVVRFLIYYYCTKYCLYQSLH